MRETTLPPVTIAGRHAILWHAVTHVDLFAADAAGHGARSVRLYFAGYNASVLVLEGEDAATVRRMIEQAAFAPAGEQAKVSAP